MSANTNVDGQAFGRRPPVMKRRSFLKLMGQGLVASSAFLGLSIPGLAETAFDYALRGQELIQKKDFSGAVAVLEKAIRIDPESDWAYGLLGRAYHGLGRPAALGRRYLFRFLLEQDLLLFCRCLFRLRRLLVT